VYFDSKGLYFTLKEYCKAVHINEDHPNPDFQFPVNAPQNFPTAHQRFTEEMYGQWMQYLF
jgi:hypothetical protein